MIKCCLVGFLLFFPCDNMKKMPFPDHAHGDEKNGRKALLHALRCFTEGWLLRVDLEASVEHLSPEFVRSPSVIEVLHAKSQPVDKRSAARIFVEVLKSRNVQTEKVRSLSEVIEPVPPGSGIEPEKLPEPYDQWYTIFRLDMASANELAGNEAEAEWLIQQMESNPLYVQAFKFKSDPPERFIPFILIWRPEGVTWKILTVGSVGM